MQPTDASDAELVAETLAGNREAFGRLYDRYARLARAVAFDICRDPQAVADVAQEGFLRAYRNLGQLREPDRFGAWLAGIARRVAEQRNRERRRDRQVLAGDGRIEPIAPGEGCAVDERDELAWILGALAEFDPRERLAIHAFYLEGQDASKAAALLGLSRSGVYALLGRAVARLARLAKASNTNVRP
jgi:RNA polymerase sigma-70 factor (ECF subfamily)